MGDGSIEFTPDGTDSAPSTPSLEYHVVMKTLTGRSAGVMTRTMFNDRASFERWYDSTMRDRTNRPLREVYDVVAHGISDTNAADLIASPENTAARVRSYLREAASYVDRFDR